MNLVSTRIGEVHKLQFQAASLHPLFEMVICFIY